MKIMTDIQGRPYALYSEVKEGTVIQVDGGFVSGEDGAIEKDGETYCILPWSVLTVKFDKDMFDNPPEYYGYKPSYEDCLYIDCTCEKHLLDGQYCGEEGYPGYWPFYMGIYLNK
jgi:hypothetical protein